MSEKRNIWINEGNCVKERVRHTYIAVLADENMSEMTRVLGETLLVSEFQPYVIRFILLPRNL